MTCVDGGPGTRLQCSLTPCASFTWTKSYSCLTSLARCRWVESVQLLSDSARFLKFASWVLVLFKIFRLMAYGIMPPTRNWEANICICTQTSLSTCYGKRFYSINSDGLVYHVCKPTVSNKLSLDTTPNLIISLSVNSLSAMRHFIFKCKW